MAHTLTDAVHVTMTIEGEDVGGDFGPGTVELPPFIAELLVAQGFATEATGKASKTKTTDPTPADTTTTESLEA